MPQVLDYLIGSLLLTIATYIMGSVIIFKKIKKPSKITILYSILHIILNIVNYFTFNNMFRIVISFIMVTIYYRIVFKKRINISMVLSFVCMIVNTISEVIFLIAFSIINMIIKGLDINTLLNTSIVNLVISAISILLTLTLKEKIRRIIKIDKKNTRFHFIILIIMILLTLGLLFIKIPGNNWMFDKAFYIDISITLLIIIISFIMLFQENSNDNLAEKYFIATKYLKTNAEKIEEYSAFRHHYKNHLIIIKGFAKDNKKICEYIDTLLNTQEYKKYKWIKEINNIPFEGLKYLVYQKLSEAENKEVKVSVLVSDKIKNLKSFLDIKGKTQLATIIGEYFDNAIYASNESSDKELNFDIYIHEKTIFVTIANTYKTKFDIDKVTLKGYTTKGDGHGTGLYEIDKIIRQNKVFETNRTIKDKYFITELSIKMKK